MCRCMCALRGTNAGILGCICINNFLTLNNNNSKGTIIHIKHYNKYEGKCKREYVYIYIICSRMSMI